MTLPHACNVVLVLFLCVGNKFIQGILIIISAEYEFAYEYVVTLMGTYTNSTNVYMYQIIYFTKCDHFR